MNQLTRQALPSDDYLLLLGAAVCVFNANNAFVIESILKTAPLTKTWHELIDLESGNLKSHITDTITKSTGDTEIADLFNDVVNMRNRIIHSFQITSASGIQQLATKDRTTQEQFDITEDYLLEFIGKNEKLCDLLHNYRGY